MTKGSTKSANKDHVKLDTATPLQDLTYDDQALINLINNFRSLSYFSTTPTNQNADRHRYYRNTTLELNRRTSALFEDHLLMSIYIPIAYLGI